MLSIMFFYSGYYNARNVKVGTLYIMALHGMVGEGDKVFLWTGLSWVESLEKCFAGDVYPQSILAHGTFQFAVVLTELLHWRVYQLKFLVGSFSSCTSNSSVVFSYPFVEVRRHSVSFRCYCLFLLIFISYPRFILVINCIVVTKLSTVKTIFKKIHREKK